ncbi:oxygen-independent coproporphyrinogen III oxidase [bacterium]|nr:oxygen-independent coproporphyrinogen III oxidase [bacterium]
MPSYLKWQRPLQVVTSTSWVHRGETVNDFVRSNRYHLTSEDRDVYRRFARLALPRHTSYPTAPTWSTDYRTADFTEDLDGVRRRNDVVSLYVHLPFCRQLCYYCACTKEIVSDASRRKLDPADELLNGVEIEIDHLARSLGELGIEQLHWGGGSPTFLSSSQLVRLFESIQKRFPATKSAEIAVEIDPRITSAEQLETLRQLGFNRISLGIQDFDEKVQRAVNRRQPLETVEAAVETCRRLKFESINFDMIYGLPFQTLESMEETVAKVVKLSPDRIAFYRLAMIPEMFRWQNVFKPADLPAGDLPLELNLLAINKFLAAGYDFIGLDHFAKPDEPLAVAAADGSLRRNFQGMTTQKELEIIGIGPSAISQLHSAIAQNVKSSHEWRVNVESNFPIERGLRLSDDDRIRQEILQQLYSFGRVDTQRVSQRFGVSFSDYFHDELGRLRELEALGVVRIGERIELTEPLGRLLVRVPAAIFDRYLPPRAFMEGLPVGQSSAVG